jgi:predicted alpha/beta superfamily hydrolase
VIMISGTAFAKTPSTFLKRDHLFSIRGEHYFDFWSKVTGRGYRVYVSVPNTLPPKEGFPVIYVLDGDTLFGMASGTAGEMSVLPGDRPAIVVGIGYPIKRPRPWPDRRNLDFTTPISAETLTRYEKEFGIIRSVDQYGDVDGFLRMIEQEVKPAVAKRAPVNVRDETLFGHSFGGLAVLRALFNDPTAYRTFVASSPSIWWNDKAVLKEEQHFSAEVLAKLAQPRVLIEVGGRETGPPYEMITNATELGERLKALRGGAGYVVETVVFPAEGHNSVVAAAISRAISFAVGSQSSQ